MDNLPIPHRRLESLETAMARAAGHPYLGVTQGGSSRRGDRGAKVAATSKSVGDQSGEKPATSQN